MKTINGRIDQNDLEHVLRLGLKPEMACPAPSRDGKINPHVSAFILEDGQVTKVFHVKPIYYLHVDGSWRPLSEVASHYGNHRIDLYADWDQHVDLGYLRWLMGRMELIGGRVTIPFFEEGKAVAHKAIREGVEIAFDSATFYPDANPETTSVDGDAKSVDETSSWATVHDELASNQAQDTATDIALRADSGSGSYRLYRGFMLFDTSSLPDAAVISAAVLSLYGLSANNGQSDSVGIVQSNPASNTAITTADFDAFTALHSQTAAAEILVSAFSLSVYNDFNLNATGIGWISLTGITKLGARMKLDYNSTAAHSSPPSGSINSASWSSADESGTAQDPKLVVTYSTGGGSGNVVRPSPGAGVAVGGTLMF